MCILLQSMSTKFSNLYGKLNAEQKKAVDTIEGPVMVIAGPGTGKTQILTLRIANILQKTDTPPDAILALTFTESAAFGVRRRLVDIVGAAGYRVHIHTFHGFANDMIARFPDSFPRIIGSRAMSDVERLSILQELVSRTTLEHLKPFGDQFFYVPSISQKIGEYKRENISVEKFAKMLTEREESFRSIPDLYHEKGAHKGAMRGKYAQTHKRLLRDRELLALYRQYEEELAERRLYDYEDMLLEAIRALEGEKELLLTVQEECQYILADEHQDANESQNKLLELLASFHDNPNLFVVGDEKQAIFRFQGASLDNFLYFKKRYSGATIVTLCNNYRSTQAILDSAHELMSHAQAHPELPRVPLSAKGAHVAEMNDAAVREKIRVVSLPRPDDERAFVADEVARLVGEGVPPRDIAVLYRVNRDADGISEALARRSVQCIIESDQNVLSDVCVRKMLALLKAVSKYGSGEVLASALHIDFLELPPLAVARLLASTNKKRGEGFSLYDALGDRKKLLSLGIARPAPFTALLKKLERWKIVAENDGLLAALDRIAEESGLISSVLRSHHPEEKLAAVNALFFEARQVRTANRDASIADFLVHLALLEEYHLSLSVPRASGERQGVRLMTTHRAKGLEFDHVYMIHANNGHWGNRTSREFFSPIFSGKVDDTDSEADERRLFYVALTRARLAATITLSRESESGTPALPSQFVEEIGSELVLYEEKGNIAPTLNIGRAPVRHALDRALVRELFAEQGLSVTALNNYLSCPWKYFYRNLIRLPESPDKNLEYGTSIHRALHDFFEQWKEGNDVGIDGLLSYFNRALRTSSLNESDYAASMKKGEHALRAYYDQRHDRWDKSVLNEYKVTVFQSVEIEGLPRLRLRGDFDKIAFQGDRDVVLYDYKTGKKKSRSLMIGKEGAENWGDYKRQLVFYKLLLTLFEGGKWQMRAGTIEFIEPDEKGRIACESFEISDEEVAELVELIRRVSQEIWSMSFAGKRCEEKDCKYCELREFVGE